MTLDYAKELELVKERDYYKRLQKLSEIRIEKLNSEVDHHKKKKVDAEIRLMDLASDNIQLQLRLTKANKRIDEVIKRLEGDE